MTKIGRNDPCPCGSGKKYKHCCLGKTDHRNEGELTRKVTEEITNQLQDRAFGSLEDADAFLSEVMEQKQAVPQLDFLGFSSEQMHRMLYDRLDSLDDLVRFNLDLDSQSFMDIPVVQNTLYFLTRLKEMQPLKATAKGNLPLTFVRELYNEFLDPLDRFHVSIRSEEEAIAVNSLRHVLRMCGWLKKVKNHYSLTKKGAGVIEEGFSGTPFFTLFNVFTRQFNWAFQDGFPPFWIIQRGFLFSLYLLNQKAHRFIPAEDLCDQFIRAFPAVIDEAEASLPLEPADHVRRCVSLRFLERFCEYFGFAEIHREKRGPLEFDLSVKKTAFYDQFIIWSDAA